MECRKPLSGAIPPQAGVQNIREEFDATTEISQSEMGLKRNIVTTYLFLADPVLQTPGAPQLLEKAAPS